VTDIGRYNSTQLNDYFQAIVSSVQQNPQPAPLFMTIFLGANDAVLPPSSAHVPIDRYEQNLRAYVDVVLDEPAFEGTKIILITPPPINVRAAGPDNLDLGPPFASAACEAARSERGYRTYASKRYYAERVMEIAAQYSARTSRVTGLNLWRILVESGLRDVHGDALWDEDILPGSGLPGASEFEKGIFTDGLHFGSAVSIFQSHFVLFRAQSWLSSFTWNPLMKDSKP